MVLYRSSLLLKESSNFSASTSYVDRFKGVGLHSPFLDPDLDSERWIRSFWEATAGTLSVARTAVSSAKVALVVVAEVGRSEYTYMRYSNGPRTLPWGTPELIGDRVWCVETILTKKFLLCK
jgi:hypothetical protein